jgi:hypothetical protein
MASLKDQHFDVVILCPSAAYEEGHSLAASIKSTSKQDDDLTTVWNALQGLLDAKPLLKSIILCPLTQLSLATQLRKVRGCQVLSRPTRLTVLRDALLEAIDIAPVPDKRRNTKDEQLVSNKQHTPDVALFPYEMKGTRILVVMFDNAQGILLKAMLTHDNNQCVICCCPNMNDLAGNIKQSVTGWNYDVMFLEKGKKITLFSLNFTVSMYCMSEFRECMQAMAKSS